MDKNILYEIIMKYERSNDWRGQTTGSRSLSFVKSSLYDKYGQSNLVAEAIYWETQGIVRVKWLTYHFDIERIFYSLQDMPEIYRITGRVLKAERIGKAVRYIQNQLQSVRKSWVKEYYK